MLSKVKQYIESNHMLFNKAKVVIGVSGGADSVCLFYVLLALRETYQLTLHVVHVNHMIRGNEADQDQAYVEKLCKENQVAFHLVRKEVKTIAKKEHLSEEEAGRNVRYEAFEQIRKEYDCDVIAVAHNSNDCAETVLFQLVRGSGLTGLTGIPAKRDRIIRPILCLTRAEIEQYLIERHIPYQTDATNLETTYTRNKIRIDVLPYLEENINKQVVSHIVKSAQMLKEVEDYIEKQTEICYNKFVQYQDDQYFFSREIFLQEEPIIQKTLIRKIIKNLSGNLKDVESGHIEDICTLATKGVGKKLDLPYDIVAYNDYKNLTLIKGKNRLITTPSSMIDSLPLTSKDIAISLQNCYDEGELIEIPNYTMTKGEESFDYKLAYWICEIEKDKIPMYLKEFDNSIDQTIVIQDKIQDTRDTIQNTVMDFVRQSGQKKNFDKEYKKSMIITRNGYTKCFDYDKIKNAVQLRTRREGDYMQIDAKGGTKKIKTIFIDQKIPRFDRDHVPLLADGNHIMWILGSRISEAYKINENTRTVLIVDLLGGK